MAKRRSTPPRGIRSGPSLSPGPKPVQKSVLVPDESERGRPTVPEIDTLAALEAVSAMERAREEMRVRQEVRTRQEIQAFSDPRRSARPSVAPLQPDPSAGAYNPYGPPNPYPPDRYEAVPQPVPSAVSSAVSSVASGPVGVASGLSGRVSAPAGPGLSGRATLPPNSARTAAGYGLSGSVSMGMPGGRSALQALPPATGLVVVEPAMQGLMHSSESPVHAYPLHWGERADPRMIMVREPDSPRAAAFRVLRYRIEQIEPDLLRTVVLAVCAPRPGHGTTTAAVNLALALSECNRARVCLMEGNLRRPALAGLLGFKPPVCLAQRLERDRIEPLAPWCVAELSASLHVLAVSDSAPRRPLVDGPAFAAGVEAMRRAGYRHVIVDGTEVLGIADMNLIEEVVDGVLLVARGGMTTATDLKVAASQLATKKLVGVLLLDGEP